MSIRLALLFDCVLSFHSVRNNMTSVTSDAKYRSAYSALRKDCSTEINTRDLLTGLFFLPSLMRVFNTFAFTRAQEFCIIYGSVKEAASLKMMKSALIVFVNAHL